MASRARVTTRALGALALASFTIHGLSHVARGEPENLLWACNLAPLLVGFGAALSAATPVAIGLCWLVFGTPMWGLDLLTGASLIPTSLLNHLGVPVIAVLALRRLRWPRRGVWWKASLGLVGLWLPTRLLTPPRANVNLAFSVWGGWERYFPIYAVYFGVVVAGASATFALLDHLARRLLRS